ncbi:hypothetical protein BT63DRAFT_427906 [Microthyrium microscopicum]|uniref:Maintenance of telomere capping protein 1 n=1 Tax=Microthyrium microscopicum TaxID=703497 RepID=A0A6A6U3D7_9PEZI|nr:hypothetical protein BT63DRAFT_427906 [Microthyrium microscopicum]
MAPKALTDDELLAQLQGLNTNDSSTPKATKPKPNPSSAADPLAALESLAAAKPLSRPNTPKLAGASRRSGTTTTTNSTGDAAHTPTSSARNSEDRTRSAARRSAESSTPLAHELTPTSEDEVREEEQQSGGGGWWGGLMSAASAARKQAEAAVKEIQRNEEAQKWAEQVRGGAGMLTSIGGELRSRALPTFTTLLHTIAPPISQHERLQIHITHDFVGYPALDPTIYNIFSRVMNQVEGGDLLVIQRGSESRGPSGSSNAGWNDGPWWRDGQKKRDLGIINGLSEGTKLTRVNAEAYAQEYFSSRGGLENAHKQATEIPNEDNPVRSSDIFIAIQAIAVEDDNTLFQVATAEEKDTSGMVEDKADERVCFAIYLHDPVHGITFSTVTQSFPRKWAEWLDAEQDVASETQLPAEISEIVMNGGIDPREWVSEWVEEAIGLGVGIIAQRYVAKRMGVGEGGIGKGKARQAAVESGAGELARAM